MKKFLLIAILAWVAIVGLGYYKWVHHVGPKIKAEKAMDYKQHVIHKHEHVIKQDEQDQVIDDDKDQVQSPEQIVSEQISEEIKSMDSKDAVGDTETKVDDKQVQDEEEQAELSKPSQDQTEVSESTQNDTDETVSDDDTDDDTSLQMDDSTY